MRLLSFVALVLLVPLNVKSVPASKSNEQFQCPLVCAGDSELADMGVLRSHRYEFKITHRITSPVDEKSQSGHVIQGKAIISGGTECTYVLKLEDVEAVELKSDGSQVLQEETARILQERVAFFGYDNGKVTGYCPSENEDPFAWNVKAAILSHLQLGFESTNLPSETIEEDVSGKCITRFEVTEATNEAISFRKRKPTAGCSNKYDYITRFDGVADDIPLTSSRNKMVDGQQECEVRFRFKKPISKVTCNETILIKSFVDQRWEKLNTIEVKTKLTLISSASGGTPSFEGTDTFLRTTLRHRENYALEVPDKTVTKERAMNLLNAVSSEKHIPSTQDFLMLVNLMQKLSQDYEAFKEFSYSEQAMSLLYDAATYAQTEASMEFLGWCIDATKSNFPIAHMSLIANPSLPFIKKATEVLARSDHKTFTMVVSNLLQAFCNSHPNCATEKDVKEVLKNLENELGSNCRYSGASGMEKVINSLRSIANLGFVSDPPKVYPVLKECLKRHPARDLVIRASAAEAFRRFSEDSEVDEILWSVITDTDEDVEVRIQAYRSWARSFTHQKLLMLKFLNTEPNKQVKSFILSHLHEVRVSNDRFKEADSLQLANADANLTKMIDAYEPNPFVLSTYKEKFISGWQYGGGVDAAVVYGPQSPIPRSINLNFTLNVLGHSFNVLEIGYRSVYSKGINRYIQGLQRKRPMPSITEQEGQVNAFPNINAKFADEPMLDTKSRLSLRMFGRDLAYHEDIESTDQLARLLETRQSLIALNETFALPTIGGLIVQCRQTLATHQDVVYFDGRSTKYGVKIAFDAVHSFKVSLNSPKGPLGYITDDKWEANAQLLFTLDVLDRIRELTGFEAGIHGMDPKVTAFKTSRSVRGVSPSGESPALLPEGQPETLGASPAILETLLGLKAKVNALRHQPSGLLTGYSLEVDRFDGLFVSFQREKPGFSNMFQSVKFEVKRYQEKRRSFTTDEELIKLNYLTRVLKSGRFTLVTVKMPWNSTYRCSVNYNTEGDFTGEVTIGKWEANITGDFKSTGPSDYELSAQLISDEISLSAKQQTKTGKRYVLAVESTGKILPLTFTSTTEFVTPKQMKHSGEIQLTSSKEKICFETQLNWTPRHYHGLLSLATGKGRSQNKWMGEFAAINHVGESSLPPVATLYNYSFFSIVEKDQAADRPVPWRVGSAATLASNASSSWRLDTRHWLNSYEAEICYGAQHHLKASNQKTYALNVTFKENKTVLLTTVAQMSMDPFSIVKGSFNASLRHYLVCKGVPGSLNVVFVNLLPEISLHGEVLCGSDWLYKVKAISNFLKSHNTIHLIMARGADVRIESPYVFRVSDGKIMLLTNSTVFLGTKELYHAFTNSNFSFLKFENSAVVKRVSDGQVIASAELDVAGLTASPPQFNLIIDLPALGSGFFLSSGLMISHSLERILLDARTIVNTGVTKRGFEAFLSCHKRGISVAFNGSVHGLTANKPATLSFDVQRSPKGYDQASLFLRTHLEDEIVLKATKDKEEERLAGELSLLCSLHPGSPTKTFTGFLYKTQISWAFTDELFKVEQHGEWNGKRAVPPGMPFRYGITHSLHPDRNGGEIHIFGEDTNMGKAVGMEMLEGLYEYVLEEPTKPSWGMESNILLNWRRYLGRGVIGSQATIKAKMDKGLKDGSFDITCTLPDAEQTVAELSGKFQVIGNELKVTTQGLYGNEQVHQAELEVKSSKHALEVEIKVDVAPLFLEAEFESRFTSEPSTSIEVEVSQKGKKIWITELNASKNQRPKFVLLFEPLAVSSGLKKVNVSLESPIKPVDMSICNFAVQGHFKTEPVLADCDFNLQIKNSEKTSTNPEGGSQLIKVDLQINDTKGLVHRAEGLWRLFRQNPKLPFTFVARATLDSSHFLDGPVTISAEHTCAQSPNEQEGITSLHNSSHDSDIGCEKPSECTLVMENSKSEKNTFTNFAASISRTSMMTTSFEINIDRKHALEFLLTQNGNSVEGLRLNLKINGEEVATIEGEGSLNFDDTGFTFTLNSKFAARSHANSSLKLTLHNLVHRRAIDLALRSSLKSFGDHRFKVKANLDYLTWVIDPRRKEQGAGLKTYLIQLDDHAIGLEFTGASSCMFTCSLPSLSLPIVFRFAYDLDKDSRQSLLQIHKPVEIDIRGLLGSAPEAFVALSNKADIISTIDNFKLRDIRYPRNTEFYKGGCASREPDCFLIVLGTNVSREAQQKLLFTLVLPKDEKFQSFNVELDFAEMTPRALRVTSRDREVGVGVWFDRKNQVFFTEVAWDRQRGGAVEISCGRNFFALRHPKRRVDKTIGHPGTMDSGDRDAKSYLQVTFKNPNTVEIKSIFLNEPISMVYEKEMSRQTWSLHRGAFGKLSKALATFSVTGETVNQLRKRNIILFKREGRTIEIDTLVEKSTAMCTISKPKFILSYLICIDSTINIDGKSGKLIFEHIPGRRIFLNCNDNVILEIGSFTRPHTAAGSFYFQYQEGALKADAKYLVSMVPMELFASIQTARAGAVLRGNASSLLDFSGTLTHNYKSPNNVLDGEIMTSLNDDTGIYHINTFWRPHAFGELLLGGLDSVTVSGIPAFIAELEETLISLMTEEVGELKKLINQTAIQEAWVSAYRYIKGLPTSAIASQGTISNFSNPSFFKEAEKLHSQITGALDRLEQLFNKINLLNTYDANKVAKGLHLVETFTREVIQKVQKSVRYFADASRPFIDQPVQELINNTLFAKHVIGSAADLLQTAYTKLSVHVLELKHLRKGISRLRSELGQVASGIRDYCEEMLGPIFRSFLDTFYRPHLSHNETNGNTFKANWSGITVNSSVYIPLWIRSTVGPASAIVTGFPLRKNNDMEKRLATFYPAIKQLGGTLKSLTLIGRKLRQPWNHKAWLFLHTAEKSHVITFDKKLKSFTPTLDSVYILAFDSAKRDIAVSVVFSADEARFVYHIGPRNIAISECGMVANGDVERKSGCRERVGATNLTMTRTRRLWEIHDVNRDVKLTFYKQEQILLVEVGDRWYGRLGGILGTPGNAAADDTIDTLIANWRTSEGRREKWLGRTQSECQKKILGIDYVNNLFKSFKLQKEDCPLTPFIELAMTSAGTRCEAEDCTFSRDSVYDAHAALASCLRRGYIRNPCFAKEPAKHNHRKWGTSL
uniref:Vitellogenin domain-containing protein n=1 Tax=Mesocestoides corti TaxID=53468 RepID=A0A5K3EQA8_MESCO